MGPEMKIVVSGFCAPSFSFFVVLYYAFFVYFARYVN